MFKIISIAYIFFEVMPRFRRVADFDIAPTFWTPTTAYLYLPSGEFLPEGLYYIYILYIFVIWIFNELSMLSER
jgi:hypothetical protein